MNIESDSEQDRVRESRHVMILHKQPIKESLIKYSDE